MQPGGRLSDIGAAVQRSAESAGFSVVREYTGHGIGRAMHEAPDVPNWGRPGKGRRLGPGQTYRSEEHTSELQSLMRISYAVFCLTKKTNTRHRKTRRPESEQTTTTSDIR